MSNLDLGAMIAPKGTEQAKCRSCSGIFYPKKSEVRRGWGIYCSKSCKAWHQVRLQGYK